MSPPSVPKSETLLALSRQDAYLQAHLQRLLDAQSEGLLSRLGASPNDSPSPKSRRTPTINASEPVPDSFIKPRSVVPVRQPAPGRIGLRSARRDIAKTIDDLARLKDQEGKILQDEITQREAVLSDVQRISNKFTGLQRQIETIESEPRNDRISDLKLTEKALDGEIRELETRLYEMKARQRHLLREIQSLENSVQSKLSSYKNALQLAEKEAQEFLRRPPLQGTTDKARGVWALPPQRRTLELARGQYQEEQEMLGRQAEEAMREKEALDEGVNIWKVVVREVGEVEKMLQVEMGKIQAPGDDVQAQGGLSRILQRIENAKDRIGGHLRMAEDRDWKLLVCCIGAELEALVEGGSILRRALDASGLLPPSPCGSEQGKDIHHEVRPSASGIAGGSADRSEDEDDGPGPDLLVSRDDA
ncbi:MAG: hypothetical protein Q9217_003516 [Psora testacea]